jgi:hypothetical protein
MSCENEWVGETKDGRQVDHTLLKRAELEGHLMNGANRDKE